MTLFENIIPDSTWGNQFPEENAKEMFYYNQPGAYSILSDISEDSGETICNYSLVILLQQMNERIHELESEIRKLNGELV
jgi:hypothetical protein